MQALIHPTIVSVVVGVVVGVGILVLLTKYAVEWLLDKFWPAAQQAATASAPAASASRRTLSGLSYTIAVVHKAASQLIGLEMSIANLAAILLSLICAVAGAAIISYQYWHNMILSGATAVAMVFLSTLIENTSLNALKSIRASTEEIERAEESYHAETLRLMQEQFQQDTAAFSTQVQITALTREQVESMKRAERAQKQARQAFAHGRRRLMQQQTRRARQSRMMAIPFAVIGVLFSAVAGGLFWHLVLASLDMWLNITIGTMFALAVSVTFVQGELQKRNKDEAIKEALASDEMQAAMLSQQSKSIVLEMTVDTMAAVRDDPATAEELRETIKEELKGALQLHTKQVASQVYAIEEVREVPQIEGAKQGSARRQKEPEWVAKMEQSDAIKRYPRLRQKLDSLRSSGRVTISIFSLVDALNCSKKVIHYRIKNGTLQVATHNSNLIRISSIIDWLETAEVPALAKEVVVETEVVVEAKEESTVAPTREEEVVDTENVITMVPVIPNGHSNGQKTNGHDVAISVLTLPTSAVAETDKLSIALSAMRVKRHISDAELASLLGVTRAESARFWKVKAEQVLRQEEQG